MEDTQREQSRETDAYQITSINGKGLGVIATRRILAGEKILEERPILMGNMAKLRKEFGIILAQLSSTKRQQILALYNAFPEDNDVGILVTNSYGLGPQGELSGLFENLSRLNHSCRPNSERCWDPAREVETLYALRCIDTGDELTVWYFDNAEMTRAERQCVMRTSWRFECKCECCSLTGAALEASDNRRAFIKKVEESVPYIPPHILYDSVKKELMLLDEEGLGGSPRAWVCKTAYKMALSMRNVEEAKSFANEGYIQYQLATGLGSRWTKEMLEHMENPTVHIMWNPLRSTLFFPPFKNLPDGNELDEACYKYSSESDSIRYKIHWCFIAEIIEAKVFFGQPTFHVRDRDGDVAIVSLCSDDPSQHNLKNLAVGNTICLMYALRKAPPVIRVEDSHSIQALPCSLQTLMEIGDRVATERTICVVCQKPANHLCVRCKVRYCSKECQIRDWTTFTHKRDCPVFVIMQKWYSYRWTEFEDVQF